MPSAVGSVITRSSARAPRARPRRCRRRARTSRRRRSRSSAPTPPSLPMPITAIGTVGCRDRERGAEARLRDGRELGADRAQVGDAEQVAPGDAHDLAVLPTAERGRRVVVREQCVRLARSAPRRVGGVPERRIAQHRESLRRRVRAPRGASATRRSRRRSRRGAADPMRARRPGRDARRGDASARRAR